MDNNNQLNQNTPMPQPQAVSPVQNPPIVKNTTLEKKSSRGWIIAEIILAILLAVSVVSYFFSPKIGQKAKEEELKTKTPEIKISDSKMSTSNWKVFEGKAIGISFKYPSNWFEEDSTWISEKKPKPFATNTNAMDLSDDNRGLTINLIQIEKNKDVGQFNKIKSYKLNEPQIESDEYDSRSVAKIMDGELSTGEEYVMYFYSNDYYHDGEEYGSKEEPPITLSVKGKDNAVYKLILTNYNDNGKNVLSSLIPTIIISNKPPEWKKYNNNTFSFSYPSEAKTSESGLGFSGKQIYITHENGDFSDPEIIIKGDKYDEAANNLDEWDYWYIDWDNFVKRQKDDPNIKIPESELVNGHRIIKGFGIQYMDGQYVDYGLKYFVFKGGYVVEILGLTGSEEVTEKVVKSIVIDPVAAGDTPDLSEYY